MAELVLNNLVKTYNGNNVVDDVSIQVRSGNVTGLLGPNGAGKTTTFYMAVGIIRPDRGTVFLKEEEITHLPMYIRARKGIGYLPQEASVFKKLTVRQNITAILEVIGQNGSAMHEKTDGIMKELGIYRLSDQKAGSLSGGERRRLEISRVLATDPMFILLDEPFAGIDPIAVIDIQNIISQLREKGIGVLISDHNVRETLCVCDFAYIMNEGQTIESGSPDKITNSPVAKKIYLGDNFRL